MTKKRYIKLAMSERMTRDEAIMTAKCSLINFGDYEKAYRSMGGLLKNRFECYMPGHEKRIEKRYNKHFFC